MQHSPPILRAQQILKFPVWVHGVSTSAWRNAGCSKRSVCGGSVRLKLMLRVSCRICRAMQPMANRWSPYTEPYHCKEPVIDIVCDLLFVAELVQSLVIMTENWVSRGYRILSLPLSLSLSIYIYISSSPYFFGEMDSASFSKIKQRLSQKEISR